MANLERSEGVSTNLNYKFLLSFCLTSLVPILVGVYVASLFIKFPFEATNTNLIALSLVFIFSLFLSVLGFLTTRQIIKPIARASVAAKRIAQGDLNHDLEVKGSGELEELSQSLKTISNNAKELLERVERLSMKDNLTGLYNATYIRERLNEEIQRAIHYQRPCSFVYLCWDGYGFFKDQFGQPYAEAVLKSLAGAITQNLSEFDRAARLGVSDFAVILPDKNKKKTIEAVQNMQKIISELKLLTPDGKALLEITMRAGISENPIDGVSSDELFGKAQKRMQSLVHKNKEFIEAFV